MRCCCFSVAIENRTSWSSWPCWRSHFKIIMHRWRTTRWCQMALIVWIRFSFWCRTLWIWWIWCYFRMEKMIALIIVLWEIKTNSMCESDELMHTSRGIGNSTLLTSLINCCSIRSSCNNRCYRMLRWCRWTRWKTIILRFRKWNNWISKQIKIIKIKHTTVFHFIWNFNIYRLDEYFRLVNCGAVKMADPCFPEPINFDKFRD